MLKTCPKCKIQKELNTINFHKDGKAKSGFYSYCKDCTKLKNKLDGPELRKKHFRARREYSIRTKFGLTKEDVSVLIDNSIEGVCEICKRPEHHATKKSLTVDHNHRTNKVRGLLCHNCNLMLGNGEDNAMLLRAGADYLDKHTNSLQEG